MLTLISVDDSNERGFTKRNDFNRTSNDFNRTSNEIAL